MDPKALTREQFLTKLKQEARARAIAKALREMA